MLSGPQGHSAARKIPMTPSGIELATRDLPAYSAVPQPTAPPRAPSKLEGFWLITSYKAEHAE